MSEFKKAKVVLIPTKSSSFGLISETDKLHKYTNGENPHNINDNLAIPQQLLIISDDETDKVKDGEWGLNFAEGIKGVGRGHHTFFHSGDKLGKVNSLCSKARKIIASYPPLITNSLVCSETGSKHLSTFQPEPTQQFIEQYIERYNNGDAIEDVLVEYKTVYFNGSGYYDESELNPKELERYSILKEKKLKINPDNTITIKSVKDSWNRQEVRGLIIKFHEEFPDRWDIDAWLKENL